MMLIACLACASRPARGDCYLDPATGRTVCAAPTSPSSATAQRTIDARAHCRITLGDGTVGSGSLIAVDEHRALVLTCAHLFAGSHEQIVVTFAGGSRFTARLVDRDPPHDLALLEISGPPVTPLTVANATPSGLLTACGFGPHGQFRGITGKILGTATAAGATHPSLTMCGAVRPGDSGGAVLNAAGQLVGVVWGQRDGVTYATCGQPLREFLSRVVRRQPIGNPPPAAAPQIDLQTWTTEIETRLRALDAAKQDKGPYLVAGDLDGYLRRADVPKFNPQEFALRTEVDTRLTSLAARFDSIHARIESIRTASDVATSGGGLLGGVSLGKTIAAALGVSGPLAVAVVLATALARRRIKSHVSPRPLAEGRAPAPIVVDSPIPAQRTVPETHYVPIEQDSFAKAHQWASEHVARKYPGATEILQAQDSLIKQHLAAH